MVVQAYILIQTEVGKAAYVAREIAEIEGVTMAEDVTGPYDVIVRAFRRIGWGWGGRWTPSKYYQHFSSNGR